jgi:hypothetical protein
MVSTTWRCVTLASTSSHSHSAHKICRFWQGGEPVPQASVGRFLERRYAGMREHRVELPVRGGDKRAVG